MGGASSKTARSTSSKIRSFPKTPSPATRSQIPSSTSPATQGEAQSQSAKEQIEPEVQTPVASYDKNQAIKLDGDARDPAFAARLHKLGIVQPNPFIPLSQQSSYPQPLPASSPSASQTTVSSQTQTPPSTTGPPPAPEYTARQPVPSPVSIDSIQHNPALLVLRARESLQAQRDSEEEGAGKKGFLGRGFLDIGSIREVVRLKGLGMGSEEIERKFGLRRGLVGRLDGEVIDVVR